MYLQDISELVSRLYPETAARCRIHRITRRRGLHHAGRRGPKRYARSCWLSGIGLEIAPHLEAAAKQRMAEGGKQAGRGRPKKVPTPVGRLKRDALIASTIKLARPPVSATAPSARRRKLRRTLAHTRKGVTAVAVGQVRPQAPAATAARMRDIQNAVGPRRTHVGIMPTAPASHGENRGSSPLGSATRIFITLILLSFLGLFPNFAEWFGQLCSSCVLPTSRRLPSRAVLDQRRACIAQLQRASDARART
jgi:hypothetical protein